MQILLLHLPDDRDRREQPFEGPEHKVRTTIVKLGEEQTFDPVTELLRVESFLRELPANNYPAVVDGFRIGVTEQPFKIPYFAVLLALLCAPKDELATDSGVAAKTFGQRIFEDFCKGFQAFLDALAWRQLRLCIHFFAHLTLAKVVSPSSMLALLQSFMAVLDEPGVSYSRSLQAALCAGEGLMLAGSALDEHSPIGVTSIVAALTNFSESTSEIRALVKPLVDLKTSGGPEATGSTERLEALLNALQTSSPLNYELPNIMPDVSSIPIPSELPAQEIPSVLVPPEIEPELAAGERPIDKREDMARYSISLFDDDITPNAASPRGYILLALLGDLLEILEVNRKECARMLLELPRWCTAGTFKPKPGASPPENVNPELPGWQLETTIIEHILSSLLALPQPAFRPIYYYAVITDLCKISPTTVGPAVGKSIRKLYSLLGEGLDVEISRRFTEWFAVHMSNFGFSWVWKEWAPDLSLHAYHPKRAFMRRAVELEIRLSYYDRIVKTLPEPFQGEEAQTLPTEAPSSEFEYELPSHPYHEAAQSLLNLLRGRSKADEVIAFTETLKTTLSETETESRAVSMVRSICMQSLLLQGSRSFSHFLNAIERYLPLLRSLATSSSAPAEAKLEILEAVAEFWRRNRQMVNIVFDKLMQYQIVDPLDVASWAFTSKCAEKMDIAGGLGTSFEWELLKGALDKSTGRVAVAIRKVRTVRKEEDDARARAKAGGGDGMDVDVEGKDDEVAVAIPETAAVEAAIKVHTTLIRDQRLAFARALEGFAQRLTDDDIVLQDWDKRSEWSRREWDLWEIWGWYRHFCRLYAAQLRPISVELQTVSFSNLRQNAVTTTLLKRIWSVAVDGEQ